MVSTQISIASEAKGLTTGTTLNSTIEMDRKKYQGMNISFVRVEQEQVTKMGPNSNVEELEIAAYDCTLAWCRKT